MARSSTSLPQASIVCHLFRLSGELRNMIYALALTEPDGLFHKDGRDEKEGGTTIPGGAMKLDMKLYNSKACLQESNQMKYVCRQLYAETRGLGLRHNDLHFVSTAPRELRVAMQAQYFLKYCSTSSRSYIRVITLQTNFSSHIDATVFPPQLDDLCRNNPNCTVKYFLPGLSKNHDYYDVGYLMRQGIFLKETCRGYNSGLSLYLLLHSGIANIRFTRAVESINAPNLRFMLCGDFHEDIIRRELNNMSPRPVVSLYGVDGWVEEIRKWYTEGI